MRALVVGALAFLVTGCSDTIRAQREEQAQEEVQNAREAYETCITIHRVDPERCASYKDTWQAAVDTYNRLLASEKPDAKEQPTPGAH